MAVLGATPTQHLSLSRCDQTKRRKRRREKGEWRLSGSYQQVGAHDSMSPLFEERDIEVHKQTDRQCSQFQVCD